MRRRGPGVDEKKPPDALRSVQPAVSHGFDRKATELSASVPVSHSRVESAPAPAPAAVAAPSGLRGATPPWVISLIGHLLVLAALWPLHMATSMFQETAVTGTVEEDEPVALSQDYFHFDTAAAETIGNGGDSSGAAGDRVAPLGPAMETPRAPVLNVVGTATALGTQATTAIKRPLLDMGHTTPDHELSAVVEMTGSSEHAGGVRGAVDRLTVEIEASLRQENTLVVWLFDATPSMKERREVIADRFDNIYHQLALLKIADHGALKTAVAKFDRTVEYLTKKPVDDVEAIKKAIRKIKDDGDPDKDSVENVFGACLNAAERFRSYCVGKERRRVMVIAVTDERGSDFSRVEEAITKLHGSACGCIAWGMTRFSDARNTFSHTFFATVSADWVTRFGVRKRPGWKTCNCPIGAAAITGKSRPDSVRTRSAGCVMRRAECI